MDAAKGEAFSFVESMGRVALLAGEVCRSLFTVRLDWAELMRQMHFIGVKSQFVVLTTGASTGIIAETGVASKIIFMMLMYVGRLGPVALALALAPEDDTEVYRFAQESVKIG